ncbi:MAG: hypothetical protein JRN52_02915 [Nitrososphaerota archaeon]|nr:hypothetical protein [Nitrososphaerota archaeon]
MNLEKSNTSTNFSKATGLVLPHAGAKSAQPPQLYLLTVLLRKILDGYNRNMSIDT